MMFASSQRHDFLPALQIHFIGIGGIGMSGIAEILLTMGYAVSGSDLRATPTTERLEELVKTTAAAHGRTVEEEWEARKSSFPLGRPAAAADIADLICFLASARAAFISGASITVDGGASRGVYL